MKQCARCGQGYEDVLPFCLKCEGYEAISIVTIGRYLSVLYRRKHPPTMWREKDE